MTTQTMLRLTTRAALSLALLLQHAATFSQSHKVNKGSNEFTIPKTWDDDAMSTLEVPLADPIGSPRQITADYYYRIPVRPIYKQYPVYMPSREPAGYMEWLKQQEPVILWDGAAHKPTLDTEANWIKAGELVLDAPIIYSIENRGGFRMEDVRDIAFYEKSGMPLTPGGIMPFVHYVIREKGKVELGSFSCGMCHTRVMPGGKVLKGAQGNLPFGSALALGSAFPFPVWQALFAAPWMHPDPIDRLKPLSEDQVRTLLASIPPGVAARHRGSLLSPSRCQI
jgi:hypothetical protein